MDQEETRKLIKAKISSNLNKVQKNVDHKVDKVFNTSYSSTQFIKNKIKTSYLAKKTSWIRKFILKLLSSNPLMKTLIFYLIILFIMSGIMMIKGVCTDKFYYSGNDTYFYSFFTVTSIMTCIGITIQPIITTYTVLGQVFIFLIIEFGGLVFTYIVSTIYVSFRSNVGNRYGDQILMQIEKGEKSIDTSVGMIKWNVIVVGSVQATFALILFVCMYYIPGYIPANNTWLSQHYVGFSNDKVAPYHNAIIALWNGVFDSASALSNTGVTLFGFANMTVYRNDMGIIIQAIVATEFILGGIGFPLFYDLIIKFKMHKRHAKYPFSLYSKLSLQAVIYVTIITTVLTYIFAYTNHNASSILNSTNLDANGIANTIYSPWGKHPFLDKNWALFFNMLNTHSAAFSTCNLNYLSTENKWVYIISMFIGCSPSASSGEIKLIILFSSVYFVVNKVKALKKFNSFKNEISKAMVLNSMLILLVGVIYVIVGTVVFDFFYEPEKASLASFPIQDRFTDCVFLSTSIYSLCGLNTGLMLTESTVVWHWTSLVMIISAQMTLALSVYIIRRNSYSDKELKIKNSLAQHTKHQNEVSSLVFNH